MVTKEDCKLLERKLAEAREEYNATHEPCHNSTCTFYSESADNKCRWYHYQEECKDYKEED